MSDTITVRVLCEWTLRHVLLKNGYRKDKRGNYIHAEKQFCHSDIFIFCGQEIEVEKSGMLDTGYQLGSNFFLKSWFVPYTLHGKTTDVKKKKLNYEKAEFVDTVDHGEEDWTGETREVGSTFPCGGVMLEVCDDIIEFKCDACYYYVAQKTTCLSDDRKLIGECSKHKRSTGKGCIYVIAK